MAPRKSTIPASAADDGRLSRNDYRLLIVLGRHADSHTGACIVRHETLAGELGLDRRSIIRLVARLKDFGYVGVEHRMGSHGGKVASRYQLLSPARQGALFEDGEAASRCDTPVTSRCDSAGVTRDVTHGVTSVTTLSKRKNSLPPRGHGHTRSKKSDRPTIADGQRELLPVTVVATSDAAAGPQRRPVEGPPLRFSAIDGPAERPRAASASTLVPVGTRIPADWQPSAADIAWATRHGLTGADLETEVMRFVPHWLQRAGPDALKADWSAAWQSWVLSWVRFRKEDVANGGQGNDGGGRAGGAVGDRGGRRTSKGDRLGDAFAAFRRG